MLEPIQRPSFDSIFIAFARLLSDRSTCRRMRVGCVITSVDFHDVYAVGYNGNAAHLANDCDSDEPGKCGCLHAEENATIHCRLPRTAPKVVYTTHQPCAMCAKRLIQVGGVTRLVYVEPYRLPEGLNILQAHDIVTERWLDTPAAPKTPVSASGDIAAPSGPKP
jgi:dCMP deaminase